MLSSVQFSSVAQSRPTLCDPMNRSTPGLPVHHQLPEFTQTHAHRVSDAIKPSHPLLSPSPPAPNPSQHQGLFQWVNSSHQVAKCCHSYSQFQAMAFVTDWENYKLPLTTEDFYLVISTSDLKLNGLSGYLVKVKISIQ